MHCVGDVYRIVGIKRDMIHSTIYNLNKLEQMTVYTEYTHFVYTHMTLQQFNRVLKLHLCKGKAYAAVVNLFEYWRAREFPN